MARQRPELFGDRVVGAFLLATSAGEVVEAGVAGRGVRLLRRRLRLLHLYLRWLHLAAPVLERFRARGTAAGRAFTRRYLFGRDDAGDPALVTEVQHMLEETPMTVTAAFYATFRAHDELASLASLRGIPVTVLCGTHDRLTPLAHSRRIAAELPDAELVAASAARPGGGARGGVTHWGRTGSVFPVEVTLDAVGRLVVPKALRDALGLLPGSTVDVSRYGAGLQVVPTGRVARLVEQGGVLVATGDTTIDDDTVFGLIDSGRR